MQRRIKRAIKRAVEGKTSNWLTVVPVACHHFDLSPTEFRNALALRYCPPPLRMPAHCDGCGATFNLEHALDCKKGDLVIQRHNEVRNALGDIASLAYREVTKEPVVREPDETRNLPALVADLGVRGVWQPQTEALFDIRVIDSDAQSHVQCSVNAVLASAEGEKGKYSESAMSRLASFSPFVLSVDSRMGQEARVFMKRVAKEAGNEVAKALQ